MTSSRREGGNQSILCTSCYKAAAAQKLYTLATMKTVISVKKAKSIQNYPGVDNFFVTETTPMVKERHEKVKEREAQKKFSGSGNL